MSISQSPIQFYYRHNFSSPEEKKDLLVADLEDVLTKKLPQEIERFNTEITPVETELSEIRDRITRLRASDTGLKKFGRVLGRVGLFSVFFVSALTLIPLVSVLVASTVNDKIKKKVDKFFDLCGSLTPSEEIDARNRVLELREKYLSRAKNPLSRPSEFSYQSLSDQPDDRKVLHPERMKYILDTIHKERNAPKESYPVLEQRDALDRRISLFSENLNMFYNADVLEDDAV